MAQVRTTYPFHNVLSNMFRAHWYRRAVAPAAALGATVFLATLWVAGWAFLWYRADNISPVADDQKLNGMPDGNILLKARLFSVRVSLLVACWWAPRSHATRVVNVVRCSHESTRVGHFGVLQPLWLLVLPSVALERSACPTAHTTS